MPAIVVGAAFPQLIEHLGDALKWRSPKLAGLAGLLGLVYGRDWVHTKLAGGPNTISAATATATTACAILGCIGVFRLPPFDADRPSLVGTWETTDFTVRSESGLRANTPEPRERWRIERRPGCDPSECGYRMTIGGGQLVTLTPAGDDAFVGTREGHADCSDLQDPDQVRAASGYDDHWTYRVVPRSSDSEPPAEASVTLSLVASATSAALAQNCPARVTATYAAKATRIN